MGEGTEKPLNMFSRFISRIVANPQVYNVVQYFFGAPIAYRHVREAVGSLSAQQVLVDIGGGTGISLHFLLGDFRYLCVEIDPVKIGLFAGNQPHQMAILGDGTRLPIADTCVDVALCAFVAHHLTDSDFRQALSEAMRVLKPEGCFILVDPLWRPKHVVSRLLWAYDRGEHPRTGDRLLEMMAQYGDICEIRRFSVLHGYLLAVVRRAPVASGRLPVG